MILLLALACAGGESPTVAPAETKPAPPVADNAPKPADTPPAAPSQPVIWRLDNIDQLVPKAPARVTTVGRPLPANPVYDTALQSLGAIVERYAGDPLNPWAISHGVLARGSEFRLANGDPAIPHLFAAYAEPRAVGARTFVGFPASLGEIRVEPHTDLLLKNMGEVGVAPDAVFATRQGNVSVADLYRHTVLKTYLVPQKNHSSFDGPNDMPWGLQALAQWAPDSELQWVSTDGAAMDLDFLTSFTVAVLTQESAFMFEAMQRGQRFQRQGQPLFSYTCGAAHLVQGAAYAVARGFGTAMDRKAVEAQVPLLFYRLPIELSIYDDAMKRNPKHRVRLLVQRMKFLGHFLETTGKMQATGLFVPTDEQMQAIEGAAQNLVLVVQGLEAQGVFANMEELRKQDEQLYLDVVGDASHAVRGLELALGRGTVRW